jgi:hypothetical protein
MSGLLKASVLLACASIFIACGSETSVAPGASPPVDQPAPSDVAGIRLSPDSLFLEEGSERTLAVTALNKRGEPVSSLPAITYTSSNPVVASVSERGVVTGLSRGTATVSATAFVAGSTLTASARVTVLSLNDALPIQATTFGWAPNPAHIKAGGMVEWQSGYIAVSGRPVTSVYLIDAEGQFLEAFDLSSGAAAFRFSTPGTYGYCSNACWDPPEFGVIYVE